MTYPYSCHWAFRVFPVFASMTRAALWYACAEVSLLKVEQQLLLCGRMWDCSTLRDNMKVLSNVIASIYAPSSSAEMILLIQIDHFEVERRVHLLHSPGENSAAETPLAPLFSSWLYLLMEGGMISLTGPLEKSCISLFSEANRLKSPLHVAFLSPLRSAFVSHFTTQPAAGSESALLTWFSHELPVCRYWSLDYERNVKMFSTHSPKPCSRIQFYMRHLLPILFLSWFKLQGDEWGLLSPWKPQ